MSRYSINYTLFLSKETVIYRKIRTRKQLCKNKKGAQVDK